MEGRAVARLGDWVVEGLTGQRWPVTDDQFRRSYTPCPDPPGQKPHPQTKNGQKKKKKKDLSARWLAYRATGP